MAGNHDVSNQDTVNWVNYNYKELFNDSYITTNVFLKESD